MKVTAVIGAGYGDEGKGLMTDYFAHSAQKNSIVVRFNGGAQAGHTVKTPDGRKFRFAHFGAGTFAGKPTYLAKHFIVNPLVFRKEHEQFVKEFGFEPKIYMNPSCIVTLPLDMALNQALEDIRGDKKHGSCGIGIWETVLRSRYPETRFTVEDFAEGNVEKLEQKTKGIVPYYHNRAKLIAMEDHIPDKISKMFMEVYEKSNAIINAFSASILYMFSKIEMVDLCILDDYDDIIFEGAQGLLLDQDRREDYPHVTASSTGLANVFSYCRQLGIKEINAVYVTRTYMTRHGVGPFPTECSVDSPPYKKVSKSGNADNIYQGSMRFGHLDLVSLACEIEKDVRSNKSDKIKINRNLAITCMDQLDGNAVVSVVGVPESKPINDFLKETQDLTSTEKIYVSYGPTRDDVKEL